MTPRAKPGHSLAKVGQSSPARGSALTAGGRSSASVAGSWVATLLDVAATRGADRAALALDVGLPAEGPEASERVPVSTVLRLFEEAIRRADDPVIGLHMGLEAKPRTFNALGYAAMGAVTLGEAALQIPRYERIVYDGGRTVFSRDGTDATVSWVSGLDGVLGEAELPEPATLRPLNEAIVAGWLAFGRWITGESLVPARVRFRHEAPCAEALREYDAFFGCPVSFGAANNALIFPEALLRLPLIHRDDDMRQVMERRADAALQDLDTEPSCRARVAQLIREQLAREVPTVQRAARALGLSERTLRRKLAAEGGSFQDVLREVRLELATRHLANPALSLVDVACLLGYAEQSAFSSAFRTWTGSSPSAWRAAGPAPA